MCNAGQEGHIFANKFMPFENFNIMMMLGVYMPNSLSPSHQENATIVHGAHTWLLDVFSFLQCPRPTTQSPTQGRMPKYQAWQVHPMDHFIYKEAWDPGMNFSVNEQIYTMQGKCKYNTCCVKLKQERLEFRLTALLMIAYLMFLVITNCWKDLLSKWFCPMHFCLLHVFWNLMDVGHQCMGNLFNSVSCACAASSFLESSRILMVL